MVAMSSIHEKIMDAVNNGGAIPAGPMVMSRITQLCRDPDATARDLAKVIQLDGNLASQVLKLVNSSFYGLSAQIKTVTHAVIILGFQEVKHLALTIPVADFFNKNGKRGAGGLDIQALWEQTLITACIARALSYHIKHPIPEQVFVSAILSKSGMLVFNNILGLPYAELVNGLDDPERLPFVEKERLGINHIQLGWMLAKKWQFPEELLNAIAYQYNPLPKGRFVVEAALIFTARRLLVGIQNDVTTKETIGKLPAAIFKELNITTEAADQVLSVASGEFQEVNRMLSGA